MTGSRPGVYKFAGFLVGGFCGAQIGMLRMRRLYQQHDPTGRLRTELEVLFKASRGQGPLPAVQSFDENNPDGFQSA